MKAIVILLFLFSPILTYAECIDLSGKYRDHDLTNPFGSLRINQSGCEALTVTWFFPDGSSSSSTVITDGKIRRTCRNNHCFLKAYTQTVDSFKGIEIHHDGERLRYDNSTSKKLKNGDLEVTNQFVDWNGSERSKKTIWRLED